MRGGGVGKGDGDMTFDGEDAFTKEGGELTTADPADASDDETSNPVGQATNHGEDITCSVIFKIGGHSTKRTG